MQHLLIPCANQKPSYVWQENVFTEDELNFLQERAFLANERGQAGGMNNEAQLNSIRRSNVSWLSKNPEVAWAFNKLGNIASSMNAKHYQFDLTGFGEPLQLTSYDHSEHGMYGWHTDYNGDITISRKLSLVVQLSDPSQYEGGNLQVMVGKEPETIRKQRGLVVAFPSYVLHQVTPVTGGNRQTLVAWVSGPAFR